jgi:hypothetical protein
MAELLDGEVMIIEINVADQLSPMLQRMIEHNPAYIRHLGKSLGYLYQKETKQEIATGEPGGYEYPERIPYSMRKALSRSARQNWYGRMAQAIGYAYDNGSVLIGWTSSTAAYYGRLQEYGFTKDVTDTMRKHFAAAGYPLSADKQVLDTPPRPVFEPVNRVLEPKIVPYVEEKLNAYMNENVDFGVAKERRVYKVYNL